MGEKKKATKAAIICYSFGDIASQFVWTFVGSYLTIFYTDIIQNKYAKAINQYFT